MKSSRIFISAVILSVLALVSCELDVPVREIIDAKQTIDRAKEVMAEKYDKKDLDNAVKELYKSHEFIKEDKAGDAKESAIKSKNLAMAAIKTSLPLLAGDTIAEAKKIYGEAEELNAAESAGEELKAADKEIKQADKLNNEKKYWDAYLVASDAMGSATAARTKALAVIPELEKKIRNLNNDKNMLASHELSRVAETELRQASESIARAESILQAKKMKEINAAIVKAEEDIKLAREKIQTAVEQESKKATVAERIKAVDADIKNLKANRGDEFAPEEIKNAEKLLGESNTLLSEGKLEETVTKVTDAEGMVARAKQNVEIGLAREKIISVSKLLEETKTRDTKKKYEAEFNEANTLLVSSNRKFEEKNYNEAVLKAEEAELIIKTAAIEIEKSTSSVLAGKERGLTGEGGDVSDKVVYTVKWRKRNTDCLWRISLRVYKNARLWPYIYKANKSQIKDPDLIFPGQKFVIPSLDEIKNPKKTGKKIKEKSGSTEMDKEEKTGTDKEMKEKTGTPEKQ